MGYFAKIDENNIVVEIAVVANDVFTINGIENDLVAEDFLNNFYNLKSVWKKTSYNTKGGIHYYSDSFIPSENQSKAFRKNCAGIGYYYDELRDAFIPPKPFPSWTLNEDTCLWDSPIPYPDITNIPLPYQLYNRYFWNEEIIDWELQKPFESWQLSNEYYYYISPIPYPTDEDNYYWNEETLNWELII